MINHKLGIGKSFPESLDRIDNWINEGSGWIVETIKSQYINISTYRPLIESCYAKLPTELRGPKKRQIKIQNNNQKCFIWWHDRHIKPIKIHTERITQKDKKLANDLNYDGIEFPVSEKCFSKIQTKNKICIIVFVMKVN